MRSIALSFILFLGGCASLQYSGYISRADHPYERQFDASFEKVASSMTYVLKNNGWVIINEVDPSIYERDDRYDNNGYQNLLIITDVKKETLHLTSMHLNVFIHSLANITYVEIRYEVKKSMVHPFGSAKNDQLVQGLLDDLQEEITK